MSTTLVVRDESPAGGTLNELALEFLTETISIRELIRGRVYQEVQDYNLRGRMDRPFQGLVRPVGEEPATNAPTSEKKFREVDWKKQFERAVKAFEDNQVLILIDERQAEFLDETFTIRPDTTVTFLRLSLLVGG